MHLSANIGDPKGLLVAFEAKIRDLEIPASKIEDARKSLDAAMNLLRNPPSGKSYNLDILVPGYTQAEDIAYNAFFKIQRGNAQLNDAGHKLFLALLQSYTMPPRTRKKVEMASRFYLKVTKLRLKTHGANRYAEMLDGYEKYIGMVRQHAETARVAVREGKEHAEGETKLKVGSFTLVNTGGFSDKVMQEITDVVQKAQAYAKTSGVGKVCYGEVQITNTISKGNVAAFYLIASDELFIRANVKADRDVVSTVLHELGHRYEHKFLSGKSRDIEHIYHLISGQERSRKNDRKDIPKPGEEIVNKGKTYRVITVLPDLRQGYKVVLSQPDNPKVRAHVSLDGWRELQGQKARKVDEDPNYKGFVSDYAKRGGPTENFAEMFAFYCLGRLPVMQSVVFEDLVFGRSKAAARRVMARWLIAASLRRTASMSNQTVVPITEGSEKQNAWATDIRAKQIDILETATTYLGNAKDRSYSGKLYNEDTTAERKRFLREAVQLLSSASNAKLFISNRGDIGRTLRGLKLNPQFVGRVMEALSVARTAGMRL